MLAFSDPEIIRTASHDYLPVAADDWYQRRRQDAEGEFFRSVADQGPRKGEGGSTRQGIYCLTASGKLLAYKNAGQDPKVMREVLREALDKWNKLPLAERRPGAVDVPALSEEDLDSQYTRSLPSGATIIRVYTRVLERNGLGELCACSGEAGGYAGLATADDHMWLTAADVESLLPAEPVAGERYALPAHLAHRLVRFHLVDNTRGEPPFWTREDIRRSDLVLHVEELSPNRARLRLEGAALLATDADISRADRGYDVALLGYLSIDRQARWLERFDLVALGDHWGQGPYTRGARPGREPLAIVMELAAGNQPADLVPPAALRNLSEYLPKQSR